MLLQGRPLYDNPADHRYFIPPPEWDVLIRAVEHGNNVLVCGERGVGKTTLLHQAQLAFRNQFKRVVFVDGNAIAEPIDLALNIRDAMIGDARHRPVEDSLIASAGPSAVLSETLGSLGSVDQTIVMVDASASAWAAYGVFGRMRDTLWQLNHHWIVAVDEDDRATALKPPADAFFDTVLRMGGLPIDAVKQLLGKREADIDAHVLAQIAAESGGNPRIAVRVANEILIRGGDPRMQLRGRARLMEAASRMGPRYAALMGELLDLGQASPSDKKLLDRLGISRARATALLRELLIEGLVEANVARGDTPGRPRTIYSPVVEHGNER